MASGNAKKGPRYRLWKQQGKTCYYCSKQVWLPRPGDTTQHHNTATLDHIIPLSRGGAFSPMQNCVVACAQCNVERGNTDARMFLLQKQGAL